MGAGQFAYAYAYDAFGRLTEVQLNGAVVEAYTYGPQGERLTETNTRRGISNRNYTYDAEDHLLTAGTASYVYNPDGYLTSKTDANGTTNYTYASRGELKRVEMPSGDVVEYRHDPLGRRVAKYLNGELIEKYLWLGRTRLLATYAPDGSLKCRFEYADGRLPLAMTSSGERFYLAYDQVGFLRAVTDANGAVVKTVSYDSFGNVLKDSNPALELPFGFAGGLYDVATELVRFGYRDYDAEVGKWTAKDPIGFNGDVNLYGYCLLDPVNKNDAAGLLDAAVAKYAAPAAVAAVVITAPALATAAVAAATAITAILASPTEIADGTIEGNQNHDQEDWHDNVDYDNWGFGKEFFYPKQPDENKENRKKAEDDCFEECSNELGQDPCSQGIPFSNCMKECMDAKGFRYPGNKL